MSFRAPPNPRSKYMKWVAAGKATGALGRRENAFHIHFPPAISGASMEFVGTPGRFQFEFDINRCMGSHVAWGDYD